MHKSLGQLLPTPTHATFTGWSKPYDQWCYRIVVKFPVPHFLCDYALMTYSKIKDTAEIRKQLIIGAIIYMAIT